MREAVGSTFLFKIMIFFIFFFASFLAIAINYSQAFRVKNQIINILEKNEGLNKASKKAIIDVALGTGYSKNVPCNNAGNIVYDPDNISKKAMGVCIKKMPDDRYTSKSNRYYKVTTYVSFNFPIIGRIFTFPVVGETKVITNLNES